MSDRHEPSWCYDCGDYYANCGGDHFWDDSDYEDEYEDETYASCDCKFCFCQNETEFGGVCGECQVNIHQG